MVQCDEPRIVMPLSSTLFPWMPIVQAVRPLAPLVVVAVEDTASVDADIVALGRYRTFDDRAAGKVKRLTACHVIRPGLWTPGPK